MPITLTYPGVYVEELPSGVHTIVGVSTSNAAFVGTAPRGLTNQPVRVFGTADFERQFGGLATGHMMGFAVRDFFLNGGSEAFIVRVVAGDAATASIPLSKSDNLSASSPGAWGNSLQIRVDTDGLKDPKNFFNLTVYDGTTGPGAVLQHRGR